MGKYFFIDTTLCTACRGCQVACKQWHNLPAEQTVNRGTHENPSDLSGITYKLVRMREELDDNFSVFPTQNKKLNWLFFPEQCRHCLEAPCLETADYPDAIYRDEETGAVIFTPATKELNIDDIRTVCPYDIPRKAEDGRIVKCDMCIDRLQNGMLPACVQTCPTGAMNFGNEDEMLSLAKSRLSILKQKYSKAQLVDMNSVRVIYLIIHDPNKYHKFVTASFSGHYDIRKRDISRRAALRNIAKPFKRAAARMSV